MIKYILLITLIFMPLYCFADNCDCDCCIHIDHEDYENCLEKCNEDNTIPEGMIADEDKTTIYSEEPTDRADMVLDDFGRQRPISCTCTAMGCFGDEPCNTCTCSDGKTYKSW